MFIPNKIFSWLTIVALTALVACNTSTIERTVSQGDVECSAATYAEVIHNQMSNLNYGKDRDQIVNTLSEMAVTIGQIEPTLNRICQVQYDIIYRSDSRPIGIVLEFPVTVTILVGNNRVCLNHTDQDGPDRYGVRVDDEDIEYPWRWVSQGPSVNGLPDGYFAQRDYVPVCFNENGEIVGYLDG